MFLVTSYGLWMVNFMEYWTGSSLSDKVTQDDINNFRFKLPAILWDSRLNIKNGYQELEQPNDDKDSPSDVEIIDTMAEAPKPSKASHQTELDVTPCVLSTGITSINTQELLGEPSAKIFTDRKELLHRLSTYIWSIDDEECLDKEWVRSTRPYLISLSLRTIRDILDENKPIDRDCFNMAVRTVACNKAWLWIEDKYHFMDRQFCSISQFGRDPRRCDKAKLLECWPNMDYDIENCSTVLLPYYRHRSYILFILDMVKRTVYIMDPLPKKSWYKGNDPSIPYITKLHNIANNFKLAMELAHPAWKDDIFYWRRKFPTWVPKTTDWKLEGFLVYSFMWSWNGVRLPVINTRSHSLRMNFLVDILKSSENECKDIIPGELQDLLKQIRN